MSRDFIDTDLLNKSRGQTLQRGDASGGSESAISSDGLARMAHQKSELNHQVADAVHEIEELRQRQDTLEQEKRDLEDLRRRQDDYTTNKKEITDQLVGSIMLLEKEEMQASRMLELLGVIKSKFKESLTEVRSVSENDWDEDAYQMELNKAIVVVEDAQNTFRKGIAKMEAAGWNRQQAGKAAAPAEVAMKMQARSFFDWFKVGCAISIPFVVFGTIMFILWLYFSGMFSV